MANSLSAPDAIPAQAARGWLADAGFVALALIVLVGFSPFMPPRPGSPLAAAPAAAGDTLHQIVYLAAAAAVLVAAWRQKGWHAVTALPPLLVLLEIWCVASALWAPAEGVALRRAGLQALLAFAILVSTDTVGPERAIRLLRWVLLGILIVNWVSIPIIPAARHLPGEIDPSLVGDWRGLYGQKNAAGAVCVLTILVFLLGRRPGWKDGLVALAAAGFLVMTRSKTPMGLLPLCLIAGWLYARAWRDSLSRAIFAVAAGVAAVLAASAMLQYADALHRLLEDPTEFTGRAEIWQTYTAFARDHPLLGAGFGMLSGTGGVSVMHPYARDGWVETIGDSHNGYLQLFVMLGGVGFVLAMAALVAEPLARFWPRDPRHTALKALLFALFLFFVTHNFTESDFLETDSGLWLVMLVVLASLRRLNRTLTPAA